jgi:predicted phage terminase large subunit-like protein
MKAQSEAVRELSGSAESLFALARLDLPACAMAHMPSFELPPHLDLLARKLEAVERGEIRRLIVSMPPRHGKSLLASVHFPAWYLGLHPDRSVIAASYGQELADDFGRRVRNTIADPVHRAVFPGCRISADSAAAHRFNLTAGGAYHAVGRGASITGRGADLLLLDDLLKDVEEANSPTVRRQLRSWFETTAFTRLQPGGAVVVIATRWSEDDLAGWLLREFAAEGWEELRLPAIAEDDDALGRPEGAALWPERYPLDALESIRRQIGSAAFASLYQQRPAPVQGRIFKREWWRHYTAPPAASEITRTVVSVDSAFKAGEDNDYTAVTVWAETETAFYLLHAWRDRIEFPDLKRKAIEIANVWNADAVLVEDKASGQSLIQELDRDTALPVVPVKAIGDKVSRAVGVTAIIEAGKVLVPVSAGWLDDFMDEVSTFPGSRHDDYTDSMVHALRYMMDVGVPGIFV